MDLMAQISAGSFKLKKASDRKSDTPELQADNSMLEMMMLQAKLKQRREAINVDDDDSSDGGFSSSDDD